jgi:trans-aconitate 2-methyltransferase
MGTTRYTFGDNEQASARLRLLSQVYEPETRDLLQSASARNSRLVVDLGCGPGWSTRLVRDVLKPARAVGIDSSENYITEARQRQDTGLEFKVHDVTAVPFPVTEPDVLFCRFLLTHLRSPHEVLRKWASIAAHDALLFIHETETLESRHPALRRYYELVARLQRHYGQTLLVGAVLDDCFKDSGWDLKGNHRRVLEKSASDMAKLHLANLRTWRHDAYASRTFDPSEIDSLEKWLQQIAEGSGNGEVVVNVARQMVAQKRYQS